MSLSTISSGTLREKIASMERELEDLQGKLKNAIQARRGGYYSSNFKKLSQIEASLADSVRKKIVELSKLRQQDRGRRIRIFTKKFLVAVTAIIPNKK